MIAEELTDNDQHDGDAVGPMLNQIDDPIETFYCDGAYDQRKVYNVLECEAANPVIPPRKNGKLWRHGNSNGPKHPRDEALHCIPEKGRRSLKVEAGYHIQSLVATTMYRLKTVFGGELKNRKLHNQKTEARLRCRILNQFKKLGMPVVQWS